VSSAVGETIYVRVDSAGEIHRTARCSKLERDDALYLVVTRSGGRLVVAKDRYANNVGNAISPYDASARALELSDVGRGKRDAKSVYRFRRTP